MNKNDTEIKTTNKKGLFQNIYFVGFLFLLSVADCVHRALEHDYKIANIVFLVFSFYLCIKIFKNKSKSQT